MKKEQERLPDLNKEEHLWAESIYGAATRKGLVRLEIRGSEIVLAPDDARAYAYSIIECAEAAQQDEFLMDYLEKRIGIKDLGDRVKVLVDFRSYRTQKGES